MSQKGINTEEEYRSLLMKHLLSLAKGETDAESSSDPISSLLDAYEAQVMEDDVLEEVADSNFMGSCI
ncbi:hypothetical protein K5X82_12055 [Halosquirtibacter xylanolyticus]|uniref:hypothetical protein n=1 Tax=Halosquirtibacter xylanolyticus TaxID=3374599 RepID=UPI00374925B4|nr:hypothetical protein K5X82_12055 [Prolixibacteraceae bacterium]